MLNVLLIGAGTMGQTHARAYAAMDDVRVAGVVDPGEESEALCRQWNAEHFNSFEQALEKLPQVDLVDVCVPTDLHKQYVLKAAANNKPVICEKPLAGNLKDAREMIDFCQSRQVRLFVGHVLRFFPEYRKAKQILDQGEIGTPAVVRTARIAGFPRGWNNWYADFQKSGGVAMDLIIHDFDFLRWCFGEAERVFAKGLGGREKSGKDYALVTVRFKSGVIAHVEGSWSHGAFTMRLEIAGTAGIIDYDSVKDSSLMLVSANPEKERSGVAVPESPLKESPYYLELKHFIECLRSGEAPLVGVEDAYRALEISLAAAASIKSGQSVMLPLSDEQSSEGVWAG